MSRSAMDRGARLEEIAEAIGDGALLLWAPGETVRSHDTAWPYRPDSDFWYVTGFAEPEAVLVYRPRSESPVTLFVRPRDREREIWDGRRAGPEGALSEYGADAAWPLDELDARLPELLSGVDALWTPLGRDEAMDRRIHGWLGKLRGNRRQPDRAPTTIRDPRPLLHGMRRRKSLEERLLLGAAASLSARAHLAAMRRLRPGWSEYRLQALIEQVFREGGASGPAYNSIVAGGANACILHYTENRDELRDGDLVLVDAGAELGMYAGDITRTFPVGRSFTAPQRDLYSAVLEVQVDAVAAIRPGMRHADLHQRVIDGLIDRLLVLGLVRGSRDEVVETESWKRYFMHGTGHYLGIDVHDVGPYYAQDGESLPYVEGVVVTVEPGLYVAPDDGEAPEVFRGIGVRIEDDVVVTADGHEVLTADVPKEVDAIEALREAALG
ncbi:MAG: M24 family metallopeptidase [Deltaproteobacteria bacterium]|nr:MAG: M24 family metallopeptidase [Deltaproteobacteria bacterium]